MPINRYPSRNSRSSSSNSNNINNDAANNITSETIRANLDSFYAYIVDRVDACGFSPPSTEGCLIISKTQGLELAKLQEEKEVASRAQLRRILSDIMKRTGPQPVPNQLGSDNMFPNIPPIQIPHLNPQQLSQQVLSPINHSNNLNIPPVSQLSMSSQQSLNSQVNQVPQPQVQVQQLPQLSTQVPPPLSSYSSHSHVQSGHGEVSVPSYAHSAADSHVNGLVSAYTAVTPDSVVQQVHHSNHPLNVGVHPLQVSMDLNAFQRQDLPMQQSHP